MKRSDRVLVIDGLRETAEVLRAVLEPRGLDVARIRGDGNHSAPDTDARVPRVVVFHQEDNQDDETTVSTSTAWSNVPRVIIRSENSTEPPQTMPGGRLQYLQKPFQYGELVHAIERMLEHAAQ